MHLCSSTVPVPVELRDTIRYTYVRITVWYYQFLKNIRTDIDMNTRTYVRTS